MTDGGLSRRELLKKAGLGGAVVLGGSVIGRSVGRADATEDPGVYRSPWPRASGR